MPRVVRKYQPVDFSYLLTPMEEKIQPKTQNTEDGEVSAAKRRRDSLMSNRRMRFVLHRHLLHDRDCARVSRIADDEFDMREDIPQGVNICCACVRQALVRQGADVNMSRYVSLAVRILDRMGASERDLRTLFLEHHARLVAADKETLTFKVGEEGWQVRAAEDGCALYHRNYCALSDEERFAVSGYHLQSRYILPFRKAVRTMCEYTWEGHLQWQRAKAKAQQKQQLRTTLIGVENVCRVFRFSLFHRCFRVVDIDGYLARRISSEKLPVRILFKQGETPFETLTLRVRRRDAARVRELSLAAKERCVACLCEDYVSACRRDIPQPSNYCL